MEKIKAFFSKYWGIIVGVVGLIFYAIFQRSKRLDAEANNSVIAADITDRDLQRRTEENKEKIDGLDKQLDKLDKDEQKAKDASKGDTEEERVDFWKDRLGDK
jgi:amino acid permease